jgi:hypothetical protein
MGAPSAYVHGPPTGESAKEQEARMTYPEPIPDLKARDARAFERRLKRFELSDQQKQFYTEARARFAEKDWTRGPRQSP